MGGLGNFGPTGKIRFTWWWKAKEKCQYSWLNPRAKPRTRKEPFIEIFSFLATSCPQIINGSTPASKPQRLRNERKAQNSGEGAEYEESERDSDDEEFCGFTPAEVYAHQPATTTVNLAEPPATTMETFEVLDAGLQGQFDDNHGQGTDEPIEEPATRTDTAETEDQTEEAVLQRSVRMRRPPNMLNYDAIRRNLRLTC